MNASPMNGAAHSSAMCFHPLSFWCTAVSGAGFVGLGAVAGDDDHRTPRTPLLHAGDDFDSIHSRHPDVGEDDIEIDLGEFPQRLRPVAGGDDCVALVRKHPLETSAHHRIIINYRNFSQGTLAARTGQTPQISSSELLLRHLRPGFWFCRPRSSPCVSSVHPPIGNVHARTARGAPVLPIGSCFQSVRRSHKRCVWALRAFGNPSEVHFPHALHRAGMDIGLCLQLHRALPASTFLSCACSPPVFFG